MASPRTVAGWGRQCDALGYNLLGTLGSCILVDVILTRITLTHLNIAADCIHPFLVTVFPFVSELFQQDNATQQKTFKTGLRNVAKSPVCLCAQITQISVICGMCYICNVNYS